MARANYNDLQNGIHATAKFLECTLEELVVLRLIYKNPSIKQKELAAETGKSLSTVKRIMESLQKKAKIYKGLQSPKYQEKLRNARLCNNDKSTIHLQRHSSFTINHTFANLGNTGHNMAQTLVITTVSTTKAHGGELE